MKNDQQLSAKHIYFRLLGYTRLYSSSFCVALVGIALYAFADTTFIWLMQPLLDEGMSAERDQRTQAAGWLCFMIVFLFLIRGIGGFLSTYFMTRVGRNVIATMRRELFAKIISMPSCYFDTQSSAGLISKFTFDVEQVAAAATNAITTIIRDGLTIIGLLTVMLYHNYQLTLFVLLVGPIISILVRIISKRFRSISKRIQGSMGSVTEVISESVNGHKEVKIFGGGESETVRFEAVNHRNKQLNIKLAATQGASVASIQFIASWAVAGMIYLAITETFGQMTPGAFVSFVGAALGLMKPLKHLTTVNVQLQKGIAASQSVFELLDRSGERDDGTLDLTRAKGDIQFHDVKFTYDETKGPVLKSVSLSVKPNTTVAFVGQSGSGKTTLVSLLPRFYELDSGRILLDGHAIDEYRLGDLRSQISMVSQHVMLFNDTVAKNIAYGANAEVSEEQVIAAAKAAHAWDFVSALPDGLNTVIGEDGVMLSGGQRQRLAIARALLKDAPILILDEATSALDTQAERHIQAALENLMQGRTTLVIAHRLSTIENADEIVVFNDGAILEQGKHDALLEKNGHYASLYRMQFSENSGSE